MKKSKLLSTMFVGVVSLIGGTMIACGEDTTPETPIVDGPEVGAYYYDTVDGEEYILSLNSGYQATILMGNIVSGGVYSMQDNDITLQFASESLGTISAEYDADDKVVTMTYEDSIMRFLQRITYTVSYDSNSGSAVESETVINGRSVVKPSDPVREGYSFIGWYTDVELTKPFIFGATPVTGDIKLYAQWGMKVFGESSYTVGFDVGEYDGAVNPESVNTIGGKLYAPPVPVRDGYIFKGWWYSATGKRDRLTAKVTSDFVFKESTTVYAVWQSATAGEKLATPAVSITSDLISWDAVSGATSYDVVIAGPEGFETLSLKPTETSVAAPFDMMGEYTVTVSATASVSSANSDSATWYYSHKALTRVSLFSVVEPRVLLFNAVENAERYLIDIDCGDDGHSHAPIDNGNSTNYNFANCPMQSDGIKFTVTAVAEGYMSSVSEVYVYNKTLDKIKELKFDESTQTVSWAPVKDAASYMVSVTCGNAEHSHTLVDNGSKTTYSLKECAGVDGGIVVKVYPKTRGYNSPEPTTYTYDKKIPATPADIRIVGTKITWASVAGDGITYSLRIGSKEIAVGTETEYDIADSEIEMLEANDYAISVRASQGDSSHSLWSDVIDARYAALYRTLTYSKNRVSWRHVIGADSYQVRVNGDDSTIKTITTGVNSADVALMRSGENKIEVRFTAGGRSSEWAFINVNAFAVSFDVRGGVVEDAVDIETRYYAKGDIVTMPNSKGISKTGYTLDGWYDAPGGADGNGARFYEEDPFSANGDIMLYANWCPKTLKVTLDYNEGGEGVTESEVKFGKTFKLPVPEIVTDSTLAFAGWCYTPDGGGAMITDEYGNGISEWKYNEDRTLYARWVAALSYEKVKNTATKFMYRVKAGKGSGIIRNITIPATYQGPDDPVAYPVMAISASTFSSSNYPNLEIVNIPASVTEIASNEFYMLTKLREINVYDVEGIKSPKFMSDNGVLLYNNTTTSEVTVWRCPRAKTGTYALMEGVTAIEEDAFYSSRLTELILPVSMSHIVRNAFRYSDIETLTFSSADAANASKYTIRLMRGAFNYMSDLTTLNLPAQKIAYVDTREVAIPDDEVNYYSDVFTGCGSLKTVNVDKNSTQYTSESGFLCSAGTKKTLLYVPYNIKAEDNTFTIPAGITAIGSHAFAGCRYIKHIIIPANSVSEIGSYAFSGYRYTDISGNSSVAEACGLNTVTFKGNSAMPIVIKDNAFGNFEAGLACYAINQINFEKNCNVTEIGDYAFARCVGISEVEIPKSVKRIGKGAFAYCTKLGDVTYENNGVGSADLTFDEDAFAECTELTGFYFGINVIEIADGGIFNGCKNIVGVEVALENEYFSTDQGVLFRNRVQTEKNADGSDKLDADGNVIYVLDSNGKKIPDPDVNEDGVKVPVWDTILYYPAGKKDGFVVPDTVKRLGNGLFKGNVDIPSVKIHKDVVFIGNDAFKGCTGLTSVEIAQGSTIRLGTDLFADCTGLTSMTLPSNITVLPNGMFKNCTNLATVTVNGNITEIGDGAFSNSGLKNLIIPSVDTSGFGYENVVVIPASVTKIGDNSFEYCGTDYVYFMPKAETAAEGDTANQDTGLTIGNSAFGSSAIQEITLPEGVTKIGSSAFYNCTGLLTINIPASVTEIGGSAFEGCINITNFDFEATPEDKINTRKLDFNGSGVFSGCSSVEAIILPVGLMSIPASTFSGCTNLKYVYIPNTVQNGEVVANTVQQAAIGASAFADCTSLGLEYVDSDGVTHKGLEFQAGTSNSLSFGNSVFSNCKSLTELNLPSRLCSLIAPNGAAILCALGESGTSYNTDGTIKDLNSRNLGTAYSSCESLVNINIDESCKDYMSYKGIPYWINRTIENDEELKTVTFIRCPRGKAGVIEISNQATHTYFGGFSNCGKITGIEFEKGGDADLYIGTNINDEVYDTQTAVFGGAKIDSIVLPARTKEICNHAFQRHPIRYVSFESNGRLDRIGIEAFDTSKLESITNIPATLTTIDKYAFNKCSKLSTISFENRDFPIKDSNGDDKTDENGDVIYEKHQTKLDTIETYAFANTGFSEFKLPSSVTTLKQSVFANCSKLNKITLSSALSKFDGAFLNCKAQLIMPDVPEAKYYSDTSGVIFSKDKNTLAMYPVGNTEEEYIIPVGTKIIAGGAFAGNKFIKKVIIPNTVETIGNGAFDHCFALEEVVFVQDDVVNENGEEVAKNLYVGETDSTIDSHKASISGWDKAGSTTNDNKVDVDASVFAYCESLRIVKFPARTKRLGRHSFYKCANLKEVVFANGCEMATLESYTFAYCTKLDTIKLPDGLIRLGSYYYAGAFCDNSLNYGHVFYGCTALKSITLPVGLQYIYDSVFANSGLESIVIPSTVTHLGKNAFKNCSKLTNVEFAKGSQLQYFYYNGSYYSSTGGDFNLAGTVDTFRNCPKLKTVILPYGLLSTGDYAFTDCTSLSDVKYWNGNGTGEAVKAVNGLPPKLKYIGAAAFSDTQLGAYTQTVDGKEVRYGDITLSADLEYVGIAAFSNTKIVNVKFAESSEGILRIIPGTGENTYNDDGTLKKACAGAFANCADLKTVTFNDRPISSASLTNTTPNNIFAAYTFRGCENLTTVKKLNDKIVEFGNYAFQNCYALKNVLLKGDTEHTEGVFIPGSVIKIGSASFAQSGIENITFLANDNDAFLYFSGTGSTSGAFIECKLLHNVDLSLRKVKNSSTADAKLTDSNKALSAYTFYHAGTDAETFTVKFPKDLVNIGTSCFDGSGLTSVKIPATVTTLGANIFYHNKKLSSLSFEARSDSSTLTLTGTSDNSNSGMFNGCTSLTSVVLPSFVNGIGNYTFSGCTGLTSVNLGSASSVGKYAFYGCSALKQIDFGTADSLVINDYAFANTGLEALVLGGNVTSLKPSAFRNCTLLESITFVGGDNGKLTELGNDAFTGCVALQSVTIPKSVTTIGYSPFASCSMLTQVKVEDGNAKFVSLDDGVYNSDKSCLLFYATGKTGEFVLPEETVEIKQGAFFGSKITKLTMNKKGESEVTIISYAFQNSTELAEIDSNCKVIANNSAFAYCEKLVSATFGNDSVFNAYAFNNCTELTTVTVPNSASVNVLAFAGCTSFDQTAAMAGKDVSLSYKGYKVDSDGVLRVEGTEVGEKAFKGDEFITSVVLVDGITSIGKSAFEDCVNLTSIQLPDSLTSIGNNAFAGTGITEIILPASITSLGKGVFAESEIQTVVFESGANELTLTAGTSLTARASAGALGMATKLESVDFGNRKLANTTFGAYVLAGDTSLTEIINLSSNITVIGASAFRNVPIESYTLPSVLITINNAAFADTALSGEITIPASVATIGKGAFANTSISSVVFAESAVELALTAGGTSVVANEKLTVESYGAFSQMPELVSLNFNNRELSVEDSTGTGANKVIYGKKLNASTFALCPKLSEIKNMSENISYIDNLAFYGCGFTNFELSSNVSRILDYAFAECVNLKTVTLPKEVKIRGLATETQYYFKGKYIFKNSAIEEIVLPRNMTVVDMVFADCKQLKSVVCSETITQIWTSAFDGCTALSDITFLGDITQLRNYAFRNCTSLTEFTIPDGVTKLQDGVFEGCTGIKKMYIHEGITNYSAGDVSPFAGWTADQTIYVVGNIARPNLWSENWNGDATVVWDYDPNADTDASADQA